MNEAYRRHERKIDPTKGVTLDDGTLNDNDRIEIGPTMLAYREWEAAGLTLPDLAGLRQFRLNRLVEKLVERDYGGVLMFDPLNIRYATDSTNMQLWNTHNPFRACLVCADGHMVLWDYKNSPFLADHNPLVREVRSGASMFYFSVGDRIEEAAESFVGEVAEVMRAHAGSNTRLAVDKIMLTGARKLEAAGFTLEEGEEVTEKARAIKGPDEILAMRCAVHACETALGLMEEAIAPGKSEDEIWAVLHAENIKRGGEWIETRLFASGPRTNPWFQECGPRVVQENEICALDTDLIGCYGLCVDISRSWWVGPGDPRPDMIAAMQHGHEHIMTNMELLAPGVPLRDLVFKGHQLDPKYDKRKYSCRMHGVGLCDEWPHIDYPDHYKEGAFEAVLEPGMMLCVEALIGEEDGDFCIKLEDQVLITEDGYENLISYPYDARLMGG
ncbi:M24 family metallopeptidase [Roseobacter sp. HKCCD9010]|uniref:dimethylsulfonioproprionate lyase DddP n=1 Tax=unclassified Roseobacter TaxID=196798 RepID=UPI0014911259|nr:MULTISPECIES: dimethylsulfonioproprionate lyase DddP [unclassified Roseobacter]MBF9050046.1 M24 family metallopeptidase [Rhodobacterales bacterium HKCCD4356]NNV12289.1 M24 family metallopeptidase [Roseobacter sp. HKCCD7357]NNV16248.1 M24 family metallopeptidase [Roseobacter sp. HKCCD8768]NNV25708.1 M24 family metallopeptidase [Roseobacter sp. HKCCD8192]NNV29964.1 M24 family metallopeptidase [Roseobacter sp. HKCCD9061]